MSNYHTPTYIPAEADLKEMGFEKSSVAPKSGEMWQLTTYNEDICGVKLPCLITYHADAGYFLVGGSYFSPGSKQDLKVIIQAFSIGPNEKIMKKIKKKKFPYLK